MTKTTSTLLLGSILTATLLLSGCGSEATASLKAPKDTTKLIRGVADDHSDWTWFVGTDATQTSTTATFTSYYMQGIPTEVKHFQYFLDTDNNAATGFSFGEDSWRISGADILVEDGAVYKSQSKTEWKWAYAGELDSYNRAKVDGIEQINFASNKSLLGITSNTVNVTIEPFDANWGSTYSTISTQAVTLVDDGGIGNAPDPKLTQALLPAGVTIDKFLVTPDNKGAILLTKGYFEPDAINGGLFGYSGTLIYVDYSDINHPVLAKKAIMSGPSYPYLEIDKQMQIIDNHTMSFFIGNDNIYSYYKVIYDYIENKQLKRLPTDVLSAANLASNIYRKTLPNPNYYVYIRDNGNKKLTDTTWLVSFRVSRSGDGIANPLPDLMVTAIYDEVTESIQVQSQNEELVLKLADSATLNKIRKVSMPNFRGIPREDATFVLGNNAYVVSRRIKAGIVIRYFTRYDISNIANAAPVILDAMPQSVDTKISNIHLNAQEKLVYTVAEKQIVVTYDTKTGQFTSKPL